MKLLRALALAVALTVLLAGSATAAPGDLDTTFSGDGILLPQQEFQDVAIAQDGRVVALTPGRTNGGHLDYGVARLFRYTTAGNPDGTFGGGDGQIDIPGPGAAGYFWPQDVLVQPDRRIVITGRVGSGPFAMRLTASGALDKTFSGDGKLVAPDMREVQDRTCTGIVGEADDIAIDSAGRIYVFSSVADPSDCEPSFTPWVWRITPSGATDTSYGTNGHAPLKCGPGEGQIGLRDIEIVSGDRLLAGGAYTEVPADGGWVDHGECMVRLKTNGTPDETFGTGGVAMGLPWDGIGEVEVGTGGVTYIIGGTSGSQFIALLGPSGTPTWTRSIASSPYVDAETQGTKVLVIDSQDWTIRRYTAQGALDLAFGGGDGTVTTTFSGTPGVPQDGAILGKRLVVVGGAQRPTTLGAAAAYKLGA